ncbi:MAG: D-aminoacyl-tRNA deacylase [Eubacteriales bacterium]|nr:D-aminoacyl-tRNA deacylase [Eubacteriales bacterium]MDD4422142.1 D-aminoacyl-tRNA deacylase [Eubacteriales bacterium]HBR32429.1 D-tyrosyl-tRNA(Tyr) deacylase [Clostridiales bacterium]
MKIVIQRVSSAECVVDGVTSGKIERGLLVFVGVEDTDGERDLQKAAQKITEIRIFKDKKGKISLSCSDIGGGVLLISNFTLCGSVKRGRRPDFISAAKADKARIYYDRLITLIAEKLPVQTGVFGSSMKITAVNDGPVIMIINTNEI